MKRIILSRLLPSVALCATVLLPAALSARAQVFVVQPEHIEKRYTEFAPTDVRLSAEPINAVGREDLIRFLQSEQGFAVRPLPISTLTLRANGPMEPSGEKYIDLLHEKGICARPGERVAITDIRIRDNDIVLDLNGGPTHKHRILRHIEVGMGAADVPLAQDDGSIPTGLRIVLAFSSHVPDLSGEQVEELLRPMIDFGVKSPAEAYAESLPPFLRKAIDEHRVLIGMDRDMVLYAKGQPIRRIREQESDGKQVEIWMYGEAPQPVEFVRFAGATVVRDELARVGQPMLVRTASEMGDYQGAQPGLTASQHEVNAGDRTAADISEENAPKAPPTLRQPGEKLPSDDRNKQPVMAPVNFPKDQQRPGDPGYKPSDASQPATTAQPAASQPASTNGQPATTQPVAAPGAQQKPDA